MHYIVLDLEWNKNPNDHARPNKLLPFEIIEVGAVKLDEDRNEVSTFHSLVKPSVYHWIDESIRQVVHVKYRELRKGKPFPDVALEFFDWCGDDYIFCTWAKQDVCELQRNLRYYYLLDLLPGPVVYLDVQKLFSLSFDDGHIRRSLSGAIDALGIKKDHGFHRALADAVYTGRVLARIKPEYIKGYESLDAYQVPAMGESNVSLRSPDRIKILSHMHKTREKAFQDEEIKAICCPVCDREGLLDPQGRKASWFTSSTRIHYCVGVCPEHGTVVGRVRIRHTDEGRYFAVKTLRITDTEEGASVMERRGDR